MDRLTAAKVFVEVIDCGSFTAAADQLNMTTPMVSRYIAAIEKWTGNQLLMRSTRKIQLTDNGILQLALFRNLLEVANRLESYGEGTTKAPKGSLRIAFTPLIGERLLAQPLVKFHDLYPKVNLNLIVSTDAIDLTENRVDIAIRISEQLEPNHIAKRIYHCPVILCASPEYLSKSGTPKNLQDLRKHHFITHTLMDSLKPHVSLHGETVDFNFPKILSFNESICMRAAALAGAGLSILPLFGIKKEIDQGKLLQILPELSAKGITIYAVYLSRMHQPVAAQLLINFLSEYFQSTNEPPPLAEFNSPH